MISSRKNRHLVFTAIIGFLLVVTFFTTGCAKKASPVVGEYVGASGGYLKISEDGTCTYSDDDSTGSGTWILEDGVITIEVDNLKYSLYANVEEGSEGLLIQGNNSHWDNEYFKRQ